MYAKISPKSGEPQRYSWGETQKKKNTIHLNVVLSWATLTGDWHYRGRAITGWSGVYTVSTRGSKIDQQVLSQCGSMSHCLNRSFLEIHLACCCNIKQPRHYQVYSQNIHCFCPGDFFYVRCILLCIRLSAVSKVESITFYFDRMWSHVPKGKPVYSLLKHCF